MLDARSLCSLLLNSQPKAWNNSRHSKGFHCGFPTSLDWFILTPQVRKKTLTHQGSPSGFFLPYELERV